MASSINASTAGAGGVITTADNSGVLNLQSNGTTIATVQSTGFSLPTASTINAANTFGFKNRIINGGMTIDQRNAGASVTPTSGQYLVDRFSALLTQASKYTAQQNAAAVTPPVGFINYLGITSSSAYSVLAGDFFAIVHKIEGLNVADLAWGTASAKTVTLSFQVRSSLTGTFGGNLKNSGSSRSYPFTYSIPTANTWTAISVTIAGDTSGTWLTTNGIGIEVDFGLGVGSTYSGTAGSWSANNYVSATGATSVVGTSGATFYITGVQLEVGSQATSFDFRDYGRELMLCQRYYQQWDYSAGLGGAGATAFTATKYSTTDSLVANAQLICAMRTAPTLTSSSATARAVLSSSISSVNLNSFYSSGLGAIVMNYTNNAVVAGFGWLDQVGILKATAEL